MNRERELNTKINQFREHVLDKDVNDVTNYMEADKLRRNIKELLNIQGKYIFSTGWKRRLIYQEQTSTFKALYVTWKKNSYRTYLIVRFNIPEHLTWALQYYYMCYKKGINTTYNVFF